VPEDWFGERVAERYAERDASSRMKKMNEQ
jgi:hypothetical protein